MMTELDQPIISEHRRRLFMYPSSLQADEPRDEPICVAQRGR